METAKERLPAQAIFSCCVHHIILPDCQQQGNIQARRLHRNGHSVHFGMAALATPQTTLKMAVRGISDGASAMIAEIASSNTTAMHTNVIH